MTPITQNVAMVVWCSGCRLPAPTSWPIFSPLDAARPKRWADTGLGPAIIWSTSSMTRLLDGITTGVPNFHRLRYRRHRDPSGESLLSGPEHPPGLVPMTKF